MAERWQDPGAGFDVLGAMRAVRDARLTGSQKAVLWALLLRRNNQTGRCDPGHKALARDSGFSVATVKRTLKALKAADCLDWGYQLNPKGDLGSNYYTVKDPGGRAMVNPPSGHGEPTLGSQQTDGGVTVSEELERELLSGTTTPSEAPKKKATAPRPSGVDSREEQELADYYACCWHKVYGTDWVGSVAEVKLAQRKLLKTHGLAAARVTLDAFFADPEEYLVRNRHPFRQLYNPGRWLPAKNVVPLTGRQSSGKGSFDQYNQVANRRRTAGGAR